MDKTAGIEAVLDVRDVMERFGCGRSKADLIMREVGCFRVGATKFVYATDVDAHIKEHGGITVRWPRRRKDRPISR